MAERTLGNMAALLLLLTLLSGCAPAAVVGGGAAATGMLGERRGATNYLEDNWVAMKVRTEYAKSDTVRLANVNVAVYRGAVLLTGAAASEEEIREAIRLAKTVRGVLRVDSELKVQHETALELAKDAVLTNKVKFKLLADDQVKGLDMHVETTKSVVYLTGTAGTVSERDQAIRITREVDGVQEVVSYIEVIPDPPPPPEAPPVPEETP